MSTIAMIVIGILVGVASNQLSRRRGVGLGYDILLGVTGAGVAGFLFGAVSGSQRATTLDPWRLIVSAAGAALFLVAWRMVDARTRDSKPGDDVKKAKPVSR